MDGLWGISHKTQSQKVNFSKNPKAVTFKFQKTVLTRQMLISPNPCLLTQEKIEKDAKRTQDVGNPHNNPGEV